MLRKVSTLRCKLNSPLWSLFQPFPEVTFAKSEVFLFYRLFLIKYLFYLIFFGSTKIIVILKIINFMKYVPIV